MSEHNVQQLCRMARSMIYHLFLTGWWDGSLQLFKEALHQYYLMTWRVFIKMGHPETALSLYFNVCEGHRTSNHELRNLDAFRMQSHTRSWNCIRNLNVIANVLGLASVIKIQHLSTSVCNNISTVSKVSRNLEPERNIPSEVFHECPSIPILIGPLTSIFLQIVKSMRTTHSFHASD